MTNNLGRFLIAMTLALTGAVVSAYLLARTFALIANDNPSTIDICSAVLGVSCDDTLRSTSSWFIDIPVAGWGLIYFTTIIALMILARVQRETFEFEALVGAAVISVAGLLVSALLAASMLTGKAPFCPMCMVVHITNLFLLPALIFMTRRTPNDFFKAFASGVKYILGSDTKDPLQARWRSIGFVTAALIAVVAYQWILIQTDRRMKESLDQVESFDAALHAYESAPQHDIPISDDDPRLGPADAPVELVVFSDFQCGGCREFAKEVHSFIEEFPNELTIVHKHYPLDKSCNPAVKIDRHPYACKSARASIAAQRQGKFWPFHDALFLGSGPVSDAKITEIAQKVGLNMDQFKADMRSESAHVKVSSDIETGVALEISGTPSVFVNGRSMGAPDFAILQTIIIQELSDGTPAGHEHE